MGKYRTQSRKEFIGKLTFYVHPIETHFVEYFYQDRKWVDDVLSVLLKKE